MTETIHDVAKEMADAIDWVLTDMSYKAPEQRGDPDIEVRWWNCLRIALEAYKSMPATAAPLIEEAKS